MRDLGTFHANNPTQFRNAEEAVKFCLENCKDRVDGCAVDCPLRKHWKIPPHGAKWPDSRKLSPKEVQRP